METITVFYYEVWKRGELIAAFKHPDQAQSFADMVQGTVRTMSREYLA